MGSVADDDGDDADCTAGSEWQHTTYVCMCVYIYIDKHQPTYVFVCV